MASTSASPSGDNQPHGAAHAGAPAPAQTHLQGQGGTQARSGVSKKAIWTRMAVWFLLSVVFALLPTGGQYLNDRQMAGPHDVDHWVWIGRAQLYLVSMGLAVSAIGEALMVLKKKHSFGLIMVSFFNMLIMLFAAYLAPGADSDKKIDSVVGQQSLIMFAAALLTSGASTFLCVEEDGVQR
ncbi:hypothetical protein [Streptomyces canus]|uniref:hypothetical protein n=1 Tax=Streptomyces canus TaxID=58343 RepID=UPI000AE8F748|nr:hypothetical protein [Streptomyces canus]